MTPRLGSSRHWIVPAVALLASGMPYSASALSVTPSADATALAGSILGSGITIVSASYIGAAPQSGTFTDGLSSGLGIESGILLTSGRALSAVGPNDSDGTSTSLNTAGSVNLDALVPGFSTEDAASLAITFSSTSGDLFFNYVFASEEYNEYVNSEFNDVFGFFIDGTNIAIAPNGAPVSINNVNCGNPFVGAGPNCASFKNNDPSSGPPAFNIEYDGLTQVLTARVTGLPSGLHTITLEIADAGDSDLDSAVFIQGGTFSSTPTPPGGGPANPAVPEPTAALLYGVALGVVGFATRSRMI